MAGSNGAPISEVVVTSHAGALVPGLARETRLPQVDTRTIDAVISELEAVSGQVGVRAGVERYCAVLVNGTSIQHLKGWQTSVAPGDRVSIVAPMGGGGGC